MAFNCDDIYEVIEQDDIELPRVSGKKNKEAREIKERIGPDSDKPGVLLSMIDDSTRVQLGKDSVEILHGFHLNGRGITEIHQRTKEILQDMAKVKLLLVKAPQVQQDGTDFYLMVKMFVEWGKAIFGFLGKPKPEGEFLVFIKDVISGNVYMPCCHDVKPIQQNQLTSHFKSCLLSKVEGSKCAFCNSTDLTSNTYSTVNFKKEHITQNVHINSIYLVLDYVKGGLKMVDVRTSDSYLLVRPFANYFLRHDGIHFGYSGLVEFLKAHIPTWQIERTPLYSMLGMYKRKAINSKKEGFTIPCEDCDCTFPTLTGFYLGKILGLEKRTCQCEDGASYYLPNTKIDELYGLAKQMVAKDENNASKNMLMALFQKQKEEDETNDGPININIDLDQLLAATKLPTNTSFISGDESYDTSARAKNNCNSVTTSNPISRKKKSDLAKIKVGDKIIRTAIIKNSRPIIHTANRIAQMVGIRANDSDSMEVVNQVYDEHMGRVDVYDTRSYETLIANVKKKLKRI